MPPCLCLHQAVAPSHLSASAWMWFRGHSVNGGTHVLTWGLVAFSADPPQVSLYPAFWCREGGRCGSASPPPHSAITPVTALAHLPLFARYHAIPPTPPRKTRTPFLILVNLRHTNRRNGAWTASGNNEICTPCRWSVGYKWPDKGGTTQSFPSPYEAESFDSRERKPPQ